MSRRQSYKDLKVYQLAHQIGVDIHDFSLQLPRYELYETGRQLRTSSKSISANLVGGFGRRRYKAEFIRFLVFAHASCNEAIEWVEYIRDCHHDLKEEAQKFLQRLDELGRRLNRFIRSVEKEHRT